METWRKRIILFVFFKSSDVVAVIARESEACCTANIIHQSRYTTFSSHLQGLKTRQHIWFFQVYKQGW